MTAQKNGYTSEMSTESATSPTSIEFWIDPI
jgi:hypothetical protein